MFLKDLLEMVRETRQNYLNESGSDRDIVMDFEVFDSVYWHLKHHFDLVGNIPTRREDPPRGGFNEYCERDARASQQQYREANERLRREREEAARRRAQAEADRQRQREDEDIRNFWKNYNRFSFEEELGFGGFGAGRRRSPFGSAPSGGRPWYEVLGLRPDATKPQKIKAYRSLAQKLHPDKGGDTEKFQELQAAKKEAGI